MQLNQLSLTEACTEIAEGRITSENLVRACLARIAEREPLTLAWASIDREAALAAARHADTAVLLKDGALGPLHGVPIGVKDIIDTVDLPTEYNSPIYRGHRPAKDAACVAILRAAGAIVLGKTETIEFAAHGRNPVTRNPHDPRRTPGGSSSGSAAAVAEAMVPLTLGTQTGGSVIRPAAFCGVFGFKPTYGTVSTEGAKPFSVRLDTIGWFARALPDIVRICEVFEVFDRPQPPAPPPAKLTLGVCRTPYWERGDRNMRNAFEDALLRLAAVGTTLVDVELGEKFSKINDLKEIIMRAEGRVAFLSLQRTHPHMLSPGIRKRMTRNEDRVLLEALDHTAELQMAFDRMASKVDAVVTPSTTGVAPLGLHYAGDPIFNGLWTLLHGPCLTVPVLASTEGLPLGLQLVGPRYSDARMLAAAATVVDILKLSAVPTAGQVRTDNRRAT